MTLTLELVQNKTEFVEQQDEVVLELSPNNLVLEMPSSLVINSAADRVPYTGATQDVDLGEFGISGGNAVFKSLNINGTNGNGHIHLRHQANTPNSPSSSSTVFADSNGNLSWVNNGLQKVSFATNNNTGIRTYTFQDKNYTVAGLDDIAWSKIGGIIDEQTDLQEALNNKQDYSVILSNTTAAFTEQQQAKLAGIQAGAEVNVNADWNATSGDAQILNKPTALSQFTNDSGFLNTSGVNSLINAQKGVVNGIASLDGSGKIPTSQLPALAITDTFVVNSRTEMLALDAQTGDIAVRTDLNKSFILRGSSPSTLSDWQELLTPTDTVLSVNGQTGAVTLTTTDINEGTNLYFTQARAREALSASGGISYNSSTGAFNLAAGIDAALIANGSVSNTEFQFLDGVTSAIQTQLDGKQATLPNFTTGQVLFGNGNNVPSTDSAFVWDNVNKRLGINVTPAARLDILENSIRYQTNYQNTGFAIIDNSGGSGHRAAYWLVNNGGGGRTYRFASWNDGTTGRFVIRDDNVGRDRLILYANGNFSMGDTITSDTSRLTLFGSGTTNATRGFTVHNSTGSSNSLIVLDNTAVGFGISPLYKVHAHGTIGTVGFGITGINNASDVAFYVAGTVTGNVAIFDGNLGATGNVNFIAKNTNSTSSTASAQLIAQVQGANAGDPLISVAISGVVAWQLGLDNSNNDTFIIAGNSTFGPNDYLAITNAGNVGIGLSSAINARTHIRGAGNTSATNTLLIQNSSNQNILQVRDDRAIGFFGVTPVTQPTAVSDVSGGSTIDAEARTAVNAILTRMRNLGLITS